jgi:integrase
MPANPPGEPVVEEAKAKTWGSTGITGLVLHVPSGIYYHRYSVKGKRTYRSLKTRRFPTAKMKLGRKSEEVEIARQARKEPTDGLRTLGDFERLFLQRLETTPQGPRTKANYRIWISRLHRVWPEFPAMLVDRVDSETLLALRNKLKRAKFHKGARGKSKKWTTGYRVGTINQTLLLLKLFLDLAREKRVIFGNPFNDDRGLFGKIFLPDKKKTLTLPSHWDMERVFEELKKPPVHFATWLADSYKADALNSSEMARFMAFSGMRLQEANAAKWEDIAGQRMQVHGTKSDSSKRIIPIIPAFANLLDEMRKRRLAEKRPIRGKILLASTCLNAIRRACLRLNLPYMTQHTMRHYFATICIESGVDVPTVSKWLGHSDGGALAMQVYGHLRDEHSITAAQRVTFGAAPSVAPVVKSV